VMPTRPRQKSAQAVLSQFFDLHPRVTTISIRPSGISGVSSRKRKLHLSMLIVVKLVNVV